MYFFTHSFIHSFLPSFIHSFTHLYIYIYIYIYKSYIIYFLLCFIYTSIYMYTKDKITYSGNIMGYKFQCIYIYIHTYNDNAFSHGLYCSDSNHHQTTRRAHRSSPLSIAELCRSLSKETGMRSMPIRSNMSITSFSDAFALHKASMACDSTWSIFSSRSWSFRLWTRTSVMVCASAPSTARSL